MTHRNRLLLILMTLAVWLSCTIPACCAEGDAEAVKPPVDELYNKTATEGYAMRLPGKSDIPEDERQAIRQNGKVKRAPLLDTAFAALEEGNPFLDRYNIITGAEIRPLQEYGIPFFWGGRSIKRVLEYAPDYRSLEAWQSSRIYYKAGVRYFVGFDCRGLIEYVWQETGTEKISISRDRHKDDRDRIIIRGTPEDGIDFAEFDRALEIGDVVVILHPDLHMMFYIGNLADYGYTEADFPRDPSILEYPLVIHCGVNAVYADRFYHLKQIEPKYKRVTVPDGGVTVSILGYEHDELVHTVRQQKQYTSWVQMPDDTWLTVIPWNDVEVWSVYR